MRPAPLPEDIPTKTTPYYLTSQYIDHTAANGKPHAETGFYAMTTPAPRFNATINPIGITEIPAQPEYRTRDDHAYNARALDGFNVSGEPVRAIPPKF